jgi:intein-encoded DNA endonuclease-like protein
MPIQKEFNKKFFKKWSEDMTYVLGFLFADGNIINTKRGTHFVGWYSSDLELMVSMAQSMSSNHKISKRSGGYVLQIGSKELFNDLVRLGLTPNKARRMQLPEIPQKYVGHFVRGYFDGDGNVWSGYTNKKRENPTYILSISITSASRDFLRGLKRLLEEEGIAGGCIYDIKGKKCSRLQYGTVNALKLYKIMYNRPYSLYLHRKKVIFEKFIKMRP